MAQASRRNRRPRVCVCPPEPVPPAAYNAVLIDAGSLDSFFVVQFDDLTGGAVIPTDAVASPPVLTINGVPATMQAWQATNVDRLSINTAETFISGDHVVLTIPVDSFSFVSFDGRFAEPVVLSVDVI